MRTLGVGSPAAMHSSVNEPPIGTKLFFWLGLYIVGGARWPLENSTNLYYFKFEQRKKSALPGIFMTKTFLISPYGVRM